MSNEATNEKATTETAPPSCAPSNCSENSLRAISLWQPWASAMASGFKRIETRSWPTSHRGDLVICSAKRKPTLAECGDVQTFMAAQTFPYGFAVCIVELYDCWPTERINGLRQPIDDGERELGNYAPGRFAWLSRNCRKLINPVPVIGRQGFWTLPLETVVMIKANFPNDQAHTPRTK